MLIVQKRHDCWWFGETGKCHNFIIMMTFAAFFALTDSCFVIMLIWSGDAGSLAFGTDSDGTSEVPIKEIWRYRYVVASCWAFMDHGHLLRYLIIKYCPVLQLCPDLFYRMFEEESWSTTLTSI
jgi:hypothetical protein